MPSVQDHHTESHKIAERLARVETRLEGLAERGWVHDLVSPIREAVCEIRHAVTSIASTHERLLRDQDIRDQQLHESQLAALKEKHEAEMAALREKTLMHVLKEKYTPVLGFLSTVLTIGTAVGSALF